MNVHVEAYCQGKQAWRDGTPCPYRSGPQREAWRRGWQVAKVVAHAERLLAEHTGAHTARSQRALRRRSQPRMAHTHPHTSGGE